MFCFTPSQQSRLERRQQPPPYQYILQISHSDGRVHTTTAAFAHNPGPALSVTAASGDNGNMDIDNVNDDGSDLDEDEPIFIDDDDDNPPGGYAITPPAQPGAVLSLTGQHPHVVATVRRAFVLMERELIFRAAFPDALDRSRVVNQALQNAARDLGHQGLAERIRTDETFSRALAPLVCVCCSSI